MFVPNPPRNPTMDVPVGTMEMALAAGAITAAHAKGTRNDASSASGTGAIYSNGRGVLKGWARRLRASLRLAAGADLAQIAGCRLVIRRSGKPDLAIPLGDLLNFVGSTSATVNEQDTAACSGAGVTLDHDVWLGEDLDEVYLADAPDAGTLAGAAYVLVAAYGQFTTDRSASETQARG
jgi:hypothetical protein